MSDFKVTNQKELFASIENNEKYIIKNPWLLGCIGLGYKNKSNGDSFIGFNTGKGFGYVLLTHFVTKALGFNR